MIQMRGVDPYGGTDLKIEICDQVVGITTGSGHGQGTVYLTPTQAIWAGERLAEMGDSIKANIRKEAGRGLR